MDVDLQSFGEIIGLTFLREQRLLDMIFMVAGRITLHSSFLRTKINKEKMYMSFEACVHFFYNIYMYVFKSITRRNVV